MPNPSSLTVDRLLDILHALDYVYPYHQSVGFLMQAAGYGSNSLNKLAKHMSDYDFYLAHGMERPHYSRKWRLHYPHDLKVSVDLRHEE